MCCPLRSNSVKALVEGFAVADIVPVFLLTANWPRGHGAMPDHGASLKRSVRLQCYWLKSTVGAFALAGLPLKY